MQSPDLHHSTKFGVVLHSSLTPHRNKSSYGRRKGTQHHRSLRSSLRYQANRTDPLFVFHKNEVTSNTLCTFTFPPFSLSLSRQTAQLSVETACTLCAFTPHTSNYLVPVASPLSDPMQNRQDALIANSEGSSGGRVSSSLQPPFPQDTRPAAPRPTGRAPRTSFTYTSRPTTDNNYVSPFSAVVPSTSTTTTVETTASHRFTAQSHSSCISLSLPQPPVSTVPAPLDGGTTVQPTTVSLAQPPPPPQQQQQRSSGPLVSPLLPSASSPNTTNTTTIVTSTVASSPSTAALWSILSRMDESQRRAATFPVDSPLLVQAGAGSGKTQTMAARIVFLLESGVPARSILGICFTRQAAETLRERVRAMLPPALALQARVLKLKTFHAFGLECLRRFGNMPSDVRVLDARRQRKLARTVVEAYAQKEVSSEAVGDLVDHVNQVKTMKVPPIQQSDPNVQPSFLFPHYQRLLHEEYRAFDFGDLQQMFFHLIRPIAVPPSQDISDGEEDNDGGGGGRGESSKGMKKVKGVSASSQTQKQQRGFCRAPSPVCLALQGEYTHFVVDEFQDFNEIQVELLALLAGDACRVTCVGDPNQCIYTWRGAMPNVFTVWKKRFPKTEQLTLALNYRSDGPIVDAANSVVHATQLAFYHREERPITVVQCVTEDDELRAVPLILEYVLRRRDPHMTYDDIAILCRTRRCVQLYCDLLTAKRIPVRQLKAMSVDRLSTMRSLLALLRLCLSPHSLEGNADVRTVLTTAPGHKLPVASAKKLFLALDSVCQARRIAEAERIRAWRHTVDENDSNAENDGSVDQSRGGGAILRESTAAGGVPMATQSSLHALGVHPETYSFFAVLQELVYHNFSREAFPKLDMSRQSRKTVRHMVQLVLHVRVMLTQPSCDVEQVLRHVLREGGYESESTSALVTRTVVTHRGTKRPRSAPSNPFNLEDTNSGNYDNTSNGNDHPTHTASSSYPQRVSALLMEQCTAQHNKQHQHQLEKQQQQSGSSLHGWRRHPNPLTSSCRSGAVGFAGSSVSGGNGGRGALDEDDVLLPEEEAEVWAEQRMNLPELVLHTYRSVHESLQREVAAQVEVETKTAAIIMPDIGGPSSASQSRASAPSPHSTSSILTGRDDSASRFSNSSGIGAAATRMQALCPHAMVLRRVLDEFVSLVPSDDYGPMREQPAEAGATADGATHWIGQVTVGTVHRAKGMEWPAVLLPGCWVGEYPLRTDKEERRIFYVAMSRAMKHLICFTAKEKSNADGDGKPSASGYFGTGENKKMLEETPYFSDFKDKLERVSFNDLHEEYLKENGYM